MILLATTPEKKMDDIHHEQYFCRILAFLFSFSQKFGYMVFG